MSDGQEPRTVARPDLAAEEGATYSLMIEVPEELPAELPRGAETTVRMTLFRKLGAAREGISTPSRVRVSSALELLYNLLPADAWKLEHQGENVTVITIDWAKVPMGIRDPRIAGKPVN